MTKLKIGQKVYLEPLGNEARYSSEIRKVTICSVGSKYFAVSEIPRRRFSIQTMMHDGGKYSSQWKVHLSKEAIEEKKEEERIGRELSTYFNHWKTKLPLSKMKQILEIINSEP